MEYGRLGENPLASGSNFVAQLVARFFVQYVRLIENARLAGPDLLTQLLSGSRKFSANITSKLHNLQLQRFDSAR